jgi:hypothetical protein
VRHRLLTFGALASLLLLLGTLTVWARSYWIGEIWQVSLLSHQHRPTVGEDEYRSFRIAVVQGYCAMEYGRISAVHGYKVGPIFHRSGPLPEGAKSQPIESIAGIESAPFPLEGPALLFAVMPAFWLALRMTRRPADRTSCGNCGYNLTGNTSGVCPECGEAIK